MRPDLDRILNLSDAAEKQRLLTWLSARSGFYRIQADPKRDTRTLRQNAGWWGYYVTPLHEYLRENEESQPPGKYGLLRAHRMLVAALMGTVSYVNALTGEIVQEPVSTHDMEYDVFDDMKYRAAVLLAKEKGIVVASGLGRETVTA